MRKYHYEDLLKIIATLRGENGCAWDKEQTHESLIPNVLEESYELVEAIKNKDTDNLKEELGDVLLQVLMQSQIAAEEGLFTIEDVIEGIASKLVYRHPHVFQEGQQTEDVDKILENWERLKEKEKKEKSYTEKLEEVPKALPALMRVYKINKKVGQIEYFKEQPTEICEKIQNKLNEVKIDLESSKLEQLEQEIGDLLFAIVSLGYFFKINPEFALTKAMEKFINRFRYIENSTVYTGKELSELSKEEWKILWEQSQNV